MTLTREQVATLHTLVVDHHAQELLVNEQDANQVLVWGYSADELIFTARVDDLGGLRIFEWMGAVA